jgi:hypothetical protein
MKKYFSQLHEKPDHHKKRFALLLSSTITLFIFGVWSLVIFGPSGSIMGNRDGSAIAVTRDREVSPFQSFRLTLAASFEAFANNFRELKSGLEAVDFEENYREMEETEGNPFDIYGNSR